MPIRKIPLETQIFYHIYNRGYNKQTLFYEHRDYEAFYDRMRLYQKDYPSISIFVWCILPNHFHFLLMDKGGGDPCISHYMMRVQQSFSKYFNTRYGEMIKNGKKSKVFEGRFNAKRIEDDEYLAQVENYISFNPVKHELVDQIEDWPYSSFSEIYQ